VLDKRAATDFVRQLDLVGLNACPLCLLDVALQIRAAGSPSTGLLQQTASMVWPEIEDDLMHAVIEARMREVHGAEQALHDLEERAWRTPLVRAVVAELAQRVVDEMAAKEVGLE
jgi:hypothetical protein